MLHIFTLYFIIDKPLIGMQSNFKIKCIAHQKLADSLGNSASRKQTNLPVSYTLTLITDPQKLTTDYTHKSKSPQEKATERTNDGPINTNPT